MSVKLRQELERRIARIVIEDLLAAGFAVSVSIEDMNSTMPRDHEIWQSTDAEAILKAMFAADEDWVKVYRAPLNPKGGVLPDGWVRFVYGNSGYDVVSDYTTSLEPQLQRANAAADEYA